MTRGILENQVRKVIPLLGVMTVGAIAVLGSGTTAKAADIAAGFDYVATPAGQATFNFTGIPNAADPLSVSFKGLVIDPAINGADTIIERKSDVVASSAGGNTPIEIVNLSLQSVSPVIVNGSWFDVFVGLDPTQASTGMMTIRHENTDSDPTQGTWDSMFGIHGIAIFAAQGSLTPQGTNFIKNKIADCGTTTSYQCVSFFKDGFKVSNAPWTHEPGQDVMTGPDSSNFFLTGLVVHDAGIGVKHGVVSHPVPEPLTMLGAATALGFGSFFKRKLAKKDKG